jgi:hypothetical protein
MKEMKMVLWGNEHKLRATNLAHVLHENAAAVASLAASSNLPASTDTTLTIWGHGGPDQFAEMTAVQLGNFIKAWKSKNASLSTVELVTCDVRHSADPNNRDSFTDKLMPLLINSGKILVNIKSLPRGGSTATTSAMYAWEVADLDGYYFIAGNDDASLQMGAKVFQVAWDGLPIKSKDCAHLFPVVKAAMNKAAMQGPLTYVASSGMFNQLRTLLVNVTTYIQNGQTLAVPKVLGK